jgi:hypothetical protein
MKSFLKPSHGKIILFIVLFLIFFFIWSIVTSFFGITMCPLELPSISGLSPSSSVIAPSGISTIPTISPTLQPSPTLEPYTLVGTVKQIPNAITHDYSPCFPIAPSLSAAIDLVSGASTLLIALISYLFSCSIVALITKIKNKNIKKK